MTCGHCGTWNEEDDHRCHRCGRRIRPANARPAPDTYPPITSQAAPAVFQMPSRTPDPVTEAPPTAPKRRTAVQPSLFGREPHQVIPISTERPERKRGASTRSSAKAEDVSRQQSFELISASQPRTARNSPEAVIYCDAPVASPVHRLLAFVIDLSIVLIAVGVLLLIYHFAGGTFPQSKYTLPIFAAMGGMVYFLYEALWCVACGETAGMRSVHLRVIHFDGREPNFRERMIRLGAAVLSMMAAGIGLLWALTDEESLTWHDHMSNTFPTHLA